jgi:hypothetical protein
MQCSDTDYDIFDYLPKHLQVTDRGMQLVTGQHSHMRGNDGHILHRIYLFETRVLQKTEPSNPKHSMEDIDHVTRPVCKPTQFRILRSQTSRATNIEKCLLDTAG